MKRFWVLVFIVGVLVLIACQTVGESEEPLATKTYKPFYTKTPFPVTATTTGTITPTYGPTPIPTWDDRTPIPNITPRADQQVYVDPNGWFSIYFSKDLKPTDSENYFAGPDGRFIEIGYFPEFGHLTWINTVCARVANSLVERPQTSDMGGLYGLHHCDITTQTGEGDWVRIIILHNPKTDPDHCWLYFKASFPATPENSSAEGFVWIWDDKVNEVPDYVDVLKPVTDEVLAKWAEDVPILENPVVTEYELPTGMDPEEGIRNTEIDKEMRPEWALTMNSEGVTRTPRPSATPTKEYNMEDFGYWFDRDRDDYEFSGDLYKGEELILENVIRAWLFIYYPDTGPIPVILAIRKGEQGDQGYLINGTEPTKFRYYHQDPEPVVYGDSLLWLQTNEALTHINVVKTTPDDIEILYTYAVNLETINLKHSFGVSDGEWHWSPQGNLIVEGEIRKTYPWLQNILSSGSIHGINGFLFKKDGRVGLYYEGEILPLEYQEIKLPVGYMNVVYNPWISEHGAEFFGKRNGVWYYVKIDFN